MTGGEGQEHSLAPHRANPSGIEAVRAPAFEMRGSAAFRRRETSVTGVTRETLAQIVAATATS